jgi:hypothetical protein
VRGPVARAPGAGAGDIARPGPLIALLVLLLGAPRATEAIEYTLQVANLYDEALGYFVRGPVGRGAGELQLRELEQMLDRGDVGPGVFLYDRNAEPASPDVARSFGAVSVRVLNLPSAEALENWKVLRWAGTPGERALWVIRPATTHWRRVTSAALGGATGGLRYFIPYRMTRGSKPSVAPAFSLAMLRAAEDGRSIWDTMLARAVDLTAGLAAVVGQDDVGADWVYLMVEQPSSPATFKVVVGWARESAGGRSGRGGSTR